MSSNRVLMRDEHGAVVVDRAQITLCVLTVAIVLAYAFFYAGAALPTGAMAGPAAPASGELSAEGPAMPGGGAFRIAHGVALPVGSVAVYSDGSFTSFATPGGGWVDAWCEDGNTVPQGARLTSPEAFTLKDGSTLVAAPFAASYTEAYSSDMRYAFR